MPHDTFLRYDQWDYNSDCERVGLSRPTRYDRAPPGQRPFPSPFQLILDGDTRGTAPDELEAPYSQHELQMIRLSYAIRQKAGWETKRLDADVRARWKQEALLQSRAAARSMKGVHKRDYAAASLSEQMVDYVLDELELHARDSADGIKARHHASSSSASPTPSSRPHLCRALLLHVAKLEAVPAAEQDWHPRSNKQVLDLVHPSLVSLLYEKTLCLPSSAADIEARDRECQALCDRLKGSQISYLRGLRRNEAKRLFKEPEIEVAEHLPLVTIFPPSHDEDLGPSSKHHQWLPADVSLIDGKCTFDSYINNLHPERFQTFYPVLAAIHDRFLPAFERVLGELQHPPARRIPVGDWIVHRWYTETWENPEDGTCESRTSRKKRPITVPQPTPFQLPSTPQPTFSLDGRTLQVIVKLANIVLHETKPVYPGGSWHVEGMLNERIVATGIYYYDEENITESRLAFRGTFDSFQLHYEQDDRRGSRIVWGVNDGDPLVQSHNSLATSSQRCIVFPNIYQHRVAPFSLLDRTRPGHRKVLVFFLIDPLTPIVSTARVPPQQKDWILHELKKPRDNESTLQNLPAELWQHVLDLGDSLDLKDAKRIRTRLMHERKFYTKPNSKEFFERPFSLCEH